MFFFKRKKINLDCFTTFSNIAERYPVRRAAHHIPEWWKALSSTFEETDPVWKFNFKRSTVKFCSGFLDLYQRGAIVPLWTDCVLRIDQDQFSYRVAISTDAVRGGDITTHDTRQHGENFPDQIHLKINSPWLMKEKTGVQFLMTACTWSLSKSHPKLSLLNGVLNFKYQNSFNINIFALKEGSPYTTTIEAGTPMAHLIPLSDGQLKIHTHQVTEPEYMKMAKKGLPCKFTNDYISRTKEAMKRGD